MKKTTLKLKRVTLGTLATRDLVEARGGGAGAGCGGGTLSCNATISDCYTTQKKCLDSTGST